MMGKILRTDVARLMRENDRLRIRLGEEQARRDELETAVVELAELYAEQDDALVELAGMIEEG